MPPFRKALSVLREHGTIPFSWRALNYANIWNPVWNTATSRRPIGTNVFDREWDLLIILDTCRPDALKVLTGSNSRIGSVNQMQSVGSMSAEWILNTFTERHWEDIAETAFVSGNIWSHRIFNQQFHERTTHDYKTIHKGAPQWTPVSSDAFGHYEIVSAVANQNDRLHPENEAIPHILTDRTIAVGREEDYERLIVHYTLPHLTFIADALDWEPRAMSVEELMAGPRATRDLRPEEQSYDPARRGEVSIKTVRQAYFQNLRLAFDYVEILLENVDAKRTVVSADHGEAFGENGLWGHPYGCPFPVVKSVPWATTTATDERTYESKWAPLERIPSEQERVEFLQNMGYL